MTNNRDISPTAAKLRELIGSSCPVCRGELDNTNLLNSRVQSANTKNQKRALDLCRVVEKREWNLLSGYKEFEGDQNTVIVKLIAGPHADAVVLSFLDKHDLWGAPEFIRHEQISPDEQLTICNSLTGLRWTDF